MQKPWTTEKLISATTQAFARHTELNESELEEMKQAVTRFSFTFSCTLGDDGNISSIGYNLQMDAAQDGATANQIMTLSVEFSQVNQVEDKGRRESWCTILPNISGEISASWIIQSPL